MLLRLTAQTSSRGWALCSHYCCPCSTLDCVAGADRWHSSLWASWWRRLQVVASIPTLSTPSCSKCSYLYSRPRLSSPLGTCMFAIRIHYSVLLVMFPLEEEEGKWTEGRERQYTKYRSPRNCEMQLHLAVVSGVAKWTVIITIENTLYISTCKHPRKNSITLTLWSICIDLQRNIYPYDFTS